MSGFALSLVLTAALLHALWNAVVKASQDRALVLASVAASHGVVGAGMISIFGLPSGESMPYLLASTFIHYFYYAFLFHAYRLGDLSQVYPISRGVAPLLVALGAMAFAGEVPKPMGWAGVGAVSLGIGMLWLFGGGLRASMGAVGAALATGVIIASYTVVDGIGVRLSQNPVGYIGLLFLLEFPIVLYVMLRRRGRIDVTLRPTVRLGLFGGLLAVGAYGLVLYAKTIAPLAAVSAVRESSVILAAIIGAVWFRERPWATRVASAAVVGGGVVLIAMQQ